MWSTVALLLLLFSPKYNGTFIEIESQVHKQNGQLNKYTVLTNVRT